MSIDAWTRAAMTGRTLGSLLMTRLTVCSDTPASAATWVIVTACRRRAMGQAAAADSGAVAPQYCAT